VGDTCWRESRWERPGGGGGGGLSLFREAVDLFQPVLQMDTGQNKGGGKKKKKMKKKSKQKTHTFVRE